jgi:acyl carrier protein
MTDQMDRQQLLIQYVSQDLLSGRSTVEADDQLLASGMVDSLGMMRLIGFIEQSFDVEIPVEDVTIENFGSIADILRYLEGLRP